tara:strand:+ start:140 stop:727 length:588 start_codon:yes stop_codon:yes gene_type:complete
MNYADLYNDLYSTDYQTKVCNTLGLFPLLKAHAPNRVRILDMGCSIGTAVRKLTKEGYDAYGVDLSRVAIEKCTEKGIGNCFENCLTDTDFSDGFFDAVISSDTLEHIDPKKVNEAILEIKRVTTSGGVVILSIATKRERRRRWGEILKRHGTNTLHPTLLPTDEWRKRLSERFELVEQIKGENEQARFVLRRGH